MDSKTLTAKMGDKVKIEYTGTLDDGTVFDSNVEDGNLLEFEIGGGQVIKGFDDAILGMKEGEEKQFSISPAEAYGEHDPTLIQKVPREIFPSDAELTPGLLFEAGLPTGEKVPAIITVIEEKIVSVDLNHPLAGKRLNFKIKLSSVTSS
ncbi:FKBP-type peptidyl-prolyl cis-trans isomerase [Candidatus Nitrosotalea bavarica]|uniref:FKBP-type peptidyl-prolyl cis-trans isomerase n=1 Tax=Candidatus Nitrosotalea bavarica TaxID=1903277 RepID=UPI001FEBE6DF|nr:peptidylprolyl isomerase [Candidatus Nitrosotalea bavarica]